MLLLLSFIITGITAIDRPTMHYQKKDSIFCLQVGKSPPLKDVRWSFNDNTVVYDKKIVDNYTEHMYYDSYEYSLCFRKLTETNSGIYKALIVDFKFKETVETHHLIVQAPVPKPVIRMSAESPISNLSAGICKLSVNCSVLGGWLFAYCNQDSCRISDRFYNKVNITISAHNNTVICIGQNHVSEHNTSKNIEETCYRKADNEYEAPSYNFIETVTLIVVVGVIISALIACFAVGLCLAKKHRHQTSAPPLIQSQPVEPHSQPATRDSTSSSPPEASYENVDIAQPPLSSPSVNPQEESRSKQSQKVDTVYSVLQLPHANDSNRKSDGGGSTIDHEVIEVPSASESGEAENYPHADTIYTMLQKPKT